METSTSLIICTIFIWFFSSVSAKPPHILFIVADDLGWNDVGFRNRDVLTPNIDKLARSGMILNSSYVNPVCTPSRNSFMTGQYAFKSGLQHIVILPPQATCSPLNYTFLPQKLKELGYATHAIGKWHLGFCKWECTPTYRGFDTFYGFYNGAEDYYTLSVVKIGGKDFRDNKTPVNATGEYSTFMYAKRAESIIREHDASRPIYMYLPFQSVHQPLQVPKKYSDMYSKVHTESRRTYLGMVTAMDEAIGNITKALKSKGMLNDTLIIFTTDNGGMIPYGGNNYPLRGGKTTLFEGGTRATAFVSGAGIKKSNIEYSGMIHAVDWMPTVLSAAGGTPDPTLDGIDQWDSLQKAGESKRTEFIYNIDDLKPENCGHAAIRMGDYKLIDGYPGAYQDWYKPDQVVSDLYDGYPGAYQDWYMPDQVVSDLYEDVSINHTRPFDDIMMLFNLKDDPNEHVDLSKKHPDIVKKLKSRLEYYHKQIVPANFPSISPSSAPSNYGGFWTPGWC
ncbi:arylsulfatase B-like [Crassostrea angulata]|uniref:arylsulfatase B-like n=1 Tax=Magallana angulata TaxID=2784310 RepID=UPI0022B0AB8B|nr:arylsulfatase B-like [Crassostrea angulata]